MTPLPLPLPLPAPYVTLEKLEPPFILFADQQPNLRLLAFIVSRITTKTGGIQIHHYCCCLKVDMRQPFHSCTSHGLMGIVGTLMYKVTGLNCFPGACSIWSSSCYLLTPYRSRVTC